MFREEEYGMAGSGSGGTEGSGAPGAASRGSTTSTTGRIRARTSGGWPRWSTRSRTTPSRSSARSPPNGPRSTTACRTAGGAGRVLLVRDQRRAAQPRGDAGGDVRALHLPCLPDAVDGGTGGAGQEVLRRAAPTGRGAGLRSGRLGARRALRAGGGAPGRRLRRRPRTGPARPRPEPRARRGRPHHADRRRQLCHRPDVHGTAGRRRRPVWVSAFVLRTVSYQPIVRAWPHTV
ncbi:hypothetical protein ACR6C2_14165 [Streptomyces sp. INA 01156]